jgi:glyoxylase-like metal-dependent hydrolase (beta-lactamase superfamily II)
MAHRRITLISTRREWLQRVGLLGGGVLIGAVPIACGRTETPAETTTSTAPAAAAPPADDGLAAQRNQMAQAPIEMMELVAGLIMLSGPGGNVVVLNGNDGKFVVDTFVQPVWPQLQMTLNTIGSQPIAAVINTHWHFDHSDNNASFRAAGARIVAHENTAKRMGESHELLGMKIPPSPADAIPTQTFADTHSVEANGERIELTYIPPAHTDTDISVRYTKANVLHAGDLFFNGLYPFIDASTGGNINGMIAASDRLLKAADAGTRIVPGHGPLADRAALTRYRDMLVTSRDRVQKLKMAGRPLEEVQKERPTADLDETWGKGFMTPENYVALVYNTL